MHWSRRVALSLTAVVAALAIAVAVGAAALGAANTAPPFPHISPAHAAQPATHRALLGGYAMTVSVRPNVSTTLNTVSVRLTRNGHTVPAARVTATVQMLEMAMPGVREALRPAGAGRYVNRATVLGMVGRWRLRITVASPRGERFTAQVADVVPR